MSAKGKSINNPAQFFPSGKLVLSSDWHFWNFLFYPTGSWKKHLSATAVICNDRHRLLWSLLNCLQIPEIATSGLNPIYYLLLLACQTGQRLVKDSVLWLIVCICCYAKTKSNPHNGFISPTTTTDLLLLSEDSSSAESLLLLVELPIDSWPLLSFPWLSLPCDSVPLPLDPLLFISTSSSGSDRERGFLRWLSDEAGGSWPLLSLPSEGRPRSGLPWLKAPMRCSCAMELHPGSPLGIELHEVDALHPEAPSWSSKPGKQ